MGTNFCFQQEDGDLADGRQTPGIEKTDQQLLGDFSRGELAAWCSLMARYQRFLKGRCRKLMGGNMDDANDLFSRVVLKVYTEQPEQLRNIRHLGGWLSRVAQNQFIDLQRERQAEERRNHHIAYLDEISGDQPRSPEQILLNNELDWQIRRAFSALPPRLRQVAQLRFMDDAPYLSIAGLLGISEANARKRAQEARQCLIANLRGYLEPEAHLAPSRQTRQRIAFGPPALGRERKAGECAAWPADCGGSRV